MSREKYLLVVLCWGWIFVVWSTVFSYRPNPGYDETMAFYFDPSNVRSVVAYGGFPLRMYAYPTPPMGPGPHQSFLPFLINFSFWSVVARLVLRRALSAVESRWFFILTMTAAIASTLFWIGYMLLKFD